MFSKVLQPNISAETLTNINYVFKYVILKVLISKNSDYGFKFDISTKKNKKTLQYLKVFLCNKLSLKKILLR